VGIDCASYTRLTQPVARGQHVVCENIWNEETPFNPFLGKAEIETPR